MRRVTLLLIVAGLVAACAHLGGERRASVQRMYVFDCGEASVPDVSPWAPGIAPGTSAVFSDNCYLIQHAQGLMMWDSGFTDALAASPDGMAGARGMTMRRRKTLASQLAEIGVTPAQVSRVAFSHTHSDHVGNANLFTAATLYIQQPEYDAAFGPEATSKFNFAPANYDKLRANPVVKLRGDHDVFGDGSVVILSTPGHTPGHQSLLVRLPRRGPVVLSGDLVHFRSNWDNRRVPTFNFDQAQSRQSLDKIAGILHAERAELWINHDSTQSAGIAHAPDYIE
jgi:N-acyl homoserine lactone hydrolase